MIPALAGFAVGAIANYQRILIYALVATLILGAVAGWGYTKGVQRLYNYQAQQAIETVKVVIKREQATERVVTKYIRVREQAVHNQATITEEVHHYENAGYCLDAGWRRLHDAAAAGALPPAPTGPDGASDAPKAAAALITVAQNYGAHTDCADRLDALQDWVRSQAAIKH